jgi:hypothetical protein
MCSNQLGCLQKLPERVTGLFENYFKHLMIAKSDGLSRDIVIKKHRSLTVYICLSLMTIYDLILLIWDVDSFSGQNSFETWFQTWYRQVSWAIDNLRKTIIP